MVVRPQQERVVPTHNSSATEPRNPPESAVDQTHLDAPENGASRTAVPATSDDLEPLRHEQDRTLARLHAHGFEILHTRTDNPKALVPRATERRCAHDSAGQCGFGTSIRLGSQHDGTVLFVLDLDGHTPTQDPEAVLRLLWERLPDVMVKCAVKRSTSGTGYAVLGRSPP